MWCLRREKRSSSAKATTFPSMTRQAEGWKQRGRRGRYGPIRLVPLVPDRRPVFPLHDPCHSSLLKAWVLHCRSGGPRCTRAHMRLYACTPVRLLHTTQQLGRSSAFERAALCCPQAGQTGVPRASKWQFVFGGRERDGHGPHTAGLGGDAERDHDLGESHAVAGTGSPATVSTSVQPASFPATKARIWASVAVPRSGNRGANSALTALPSSACPETPAPTSLPRRRTVPTFLPMDVGR